MADETDNGSETGSSQRSPSPIVSETMELAPKTRRAIEEQIRLEQTIKIESAIISKKPTGLIEILSDVDRLRDLDLRGKKEALNLERPVNREAIMVQLRGHTPPSLCSHCNRGLGPFTLRELSLQQPRHALYTARDVILLWSGCKGRT
ncbi:hypothetical protein TEQG_01542 [Trichophyton equinum CBS 127.97]|uniref:Uncharacterized protein n=1 Tax=Trichophyton equinum (strain ATCC MYA-4606 / CBS 127.97) TaxID=559882 RepID=F2PKT9_TRIEC|nr:hypothetical protein TEQG_01542 [Trichophyton equinum CBS 127.97]